MFGSTRGIFSAERGSTTSWLAGITSVALLIGTVALPAVATESDPSAATTAVEQTEDPAAAEVTSESTPAEDPTAEEDPAADEAIIGDAVEDEAPVAEEPSVSSSDSSETPADSPAADAPAADEPTSGESSAHAVEAPAASSSDGTTPDNNSPPVEEFVPGVKVVAGDKSATLVWPDFGAGENYVVQIEKADGTWKNVDADVTDLSADTPKAEVELPGYLENQATVNGLKNGKEYQVRIVSAEELSVAEDATEPAVESADISGRGTAARIVVRTPGNNDHATSTQALSAQAAAVPVTAENPPFVEKCGLNIAIVVDRSGSIGSSNMTLQESALQAMVQSFVGTGTRVSIVSYAATATTDIAGKVINTQDDADAVKAVIDWTSDGSTNWQAGLDQVLSLNPAPDLVLFMSDGRPNTVLPSAIPGDYVGSTDFSQTALNSAIVKANAVKAMATSPLRSRIFGLAVGSANESGSLGETSIKAVSGSVPWVSGSIKTADFMAVEDFSELQAQLLAITTSFCSTLTKTSPTAGQTVDPGQVLDYKVTISNTAPAGGPALTGTTLEDTLPAGVTFKAVTSGPAPSSTSGGKVTWTGIDLAAGASQTFEYQVTVNGDAPVGELKNTARWNSLEASTTHAVSAYRLTLVARYCKDYTDIQRNRADNNIRETFAQLGADADPPYTNNMAANPVNPTNEAVTSSQVTDCIALDDWQFTLGTGITGGTPSDPSIVTGAFGPTPQGIQPPRTTASVPELDDAGLPVGTNTVAGAVTVNLTPEQVDLAKSGGLWVQGGKAKQGANYSGLQVNQDEYKKADGSAKYAFATLRCVVDDLNGDNVEYVKFGTGVKHGFCYAYYVDNPNFGTIIVKKTIDGTDPLQGGTTFAYTGTVSYFDDGAFSLKGGESQTFQREPRSAAGDTPWVVEEQAQDGWLLKSVVCTSTNTGGNASVVTYDGAKASIKLTKGDTVTCEYTNTRSDVKIDVEKLVSVDGGAFVDADSAPGPKVAVGDPATFKFVVRNTGNVTLTGVTLTDDVFAFAGSECAIPSTLVPGGSFTCEITRTMASTGQHKDTATAVGFNGRTKADDTDSAHVLVTYVDIVVTKDDFDKVVVAGDPTAFPYSISVWNQGSGDLTDDVQVADTLELPLLFAPIAEQTSDVQDWCEFDGQDMTCTIPKSEVGDNEDDTATLDVMVYAPEGAPAGTYDNVVIVSTPGDESCLPGEDCDPPDCTVDEQELGNVACDDTTVTRGSLEVRKVDLVTQRALADAEFQLWNDKGTLGTLDALDTPVGAAQRTTSPGGTTSWTDLPWGTYLIQEVAAPAGYGLSTPAFRTATVPCTRPVLDDVSFRNQTPNRCGGPIVFANPPLGSIEVVKVDKATKEVLAGAKFQLWNDVNGNGTLEVDGDTLNGAEQTTGPTGTASWTDLPWGKYLVQEVTPPADYALSNPAVQPAVIDLAIFQCEQPTAADAAVVAVESTCTSGVVSLTFANPGILKGIEIKKTVSRSATFTGPDDFFTSVGGKPGTTSVYRFEVTNTGNGPVSNLVLTDDMFVGSSQSNPSNPSVLTEANINNCRVGSLDGSIKFTFGTPIAGYVLPSDNPATKDVNEGKVFLYCDLPIPANLQLKDFEAIYNTSSISGTTEVSGDVKADSNFTVITIVGFDAFPIKNIVASDLTNPRKFDNLGDPNAATTVTFDLTVDNVSEKPLYFTLYDYFENQSLGLSANQRRAIFNNMRCIDYDNPGAYTGIPNPQTAGTEFFNVGPVDTTFGADSEGKGAGTFYSRSKDLGWLKGGDGYEILCSVILPPGKFNLVNTFRMVANPTSPTGAGAPDSVKSIMSVPMRILSMVRSADTATAVAATSGGIDTTDSAGVLLGVPTAEKPGITKTANPASGSTVVRDQEVTYTVVASNAGGTQVTGPVVDTLPAGFTVNAASISDGGQLSNGAITWNVTLDAGASKTLTYKGTVSASAANGAQLLNKVTFQNLTATTTHTVEVPPVSPTEDVVADEDDEVVAGEEDEDLADTGAKNVGNLVGAALVAMLAGGLMVTFGRRRRNQG